MNPMTFLELAVDLRKECSVAGVGPVSIADNRAEYQRLVMWIRDADSEIQGKYANWRFLHSSNEFETEDMKEHYRTGQELPNDINLYRPHSFLINSETLIDVDIFEYNQHVHPIEYGTPTLVIIQPDNNLKLWPVPDNNSYTVEFEYYKKPQVLTEGNDITLIPEPWHKLIVYRAMMMYGNYENAPEVKQAGVEGVATLMPQLEANQLPGQRDMSLVNENEIVVRPQ